MEFVRMYEHWTEDDWKQVMWTDETKINLFGSDGVKWGWKKGNNNSDPRIISQTVKHGGGNIMVWGCMTWEGPGFISRIEGGLDSTLYVEILDECIPLTLEYYEIDQNTMIFQQDNDPKHTSRIASKYFEDKKMNLLYWPPQSPDLNPIEHLWMHLKRELSKFPDHPKGCNMLWEHVVSVFNSIKPEVCQNLIRSMPDRIQAVKRAKGGHTKY
jgi:DDE superfamily endonuclease